MTASNADQPNFHYRVAGAVVAGGRVLLHKSELDEFWSLPGGHVELFEPAEKALRREIGEELGLEPEIERLLWVVESFFRSGGHRHHEIGLYFLMSFPLESALYTHEDAFWGQEDSGLYADQKLKLTFQWFPQEKQALTTLPVYPAFLQEALVILPEVPQHIIQHDADFY
jgi:ADP-ribose pyrophosphatase YjhB (NUDIX family)